MTDSTKRVLRTAYQIVVALVTFVPIVVLALPSDAQAAPVVIAAGVWIGVVARIINSLEDAGWIPAPWRASAESIRSEEHVELAKKIADEVAKAQTGKLVVNGDDLIAVIKAANRKHGRRPGDLE